MIRRARRKEAIPEPAATVAWRGMGPAALAAASLAAVVASLLWTHRGAAPLPPGTRADLLVVHKSARRMTLYSHGSVVRTYTIALGHNPVGPKRRQGDHRTPEGWYVVDRHNPNSAFHRSLHLSYPSARDAARAHAAGQSPGGDVMIHGTRNGLGWLGRIHLAADWTDGCIAVTDPEMDELYALVPDGTPIDIKP